MQNEDGENTMRSRHMWLVATAGLFGLLLLAACTRYARVAQTQFQLSDFRGDTKTVKGKLQNVRLTLDHKTKKATLTNASGAEIVMDFTIRPQSQWLLGCPKTNPHKMEVIDLKVPQVAIGRFTIRNPIIQAATCQPKGGFFIREASQIKSDAKSNARWKCEMAEMCLRFQPIK